jgi:hypothetical protein
MFQVRTIGERGGGGDVVETVMLLVGYQETIVEVKEDKSNKVGATIY